MDEDDLKRGIWFKPPSPGQKAHKNRKSDPDFKPMTNAERQKKYYLKKKSEKYKFLENDGADIVAEHNEDFDK